MTILIFLMRLTCGAMLLVFSIRFMRIGIKRLWSTQFPHRPVSALNPLAVWPFMWVPASICTLFEQHIKLAPHHAG